jgi:hypothetical protein
MGRLSGTLTAVAAWLVAASYVVLAVSLLVVGLRSERE